jgi:hypothetical protein
LEPLYPPCCPPFRRRPVADPGASGPLPRPSVPARADPRAPSRGPPPAHRPAAIRRATPAQPCAPKPSRWNDQRPRSLQLRLGAASSPRRARSQSAAEPDAPHTFSGAEVWEVSNVTMAEGDERGRAAAWALLRGDPGLCTDARDGLVPRPAPRQQRDAGHTDGWRNVVGCGSSQTRSSTTVCVYYCRTFYKVVRVGGGG